MRSYNSIAVAESTPGFPHFEIDSMSVLVRCAILVLFGFDYRTGADRAPIVSWPCWLL